MSTVEKGIPSKSVQRSDESKEVLREKLKFDEVLDCSENLDTQCGLGCGHKPLLQRFANQTTFIVLFGLIGSVMAMTYAYFNGTISTLEKRFHLSSRSIGITQIGGDLTQTFTCLFLVHYISKKHRPRWMAFGILLICSHCLLTSTLHWIYGPGEDALKLTKEFGSSELLIKDITNASNLPANTTNLCNSMTSVDQCKTEVVTPHEGHPVLILFLSHALSGFAWALYHTLGLVYMDDNVEKSKTASMYSFSTFLSMLGPSCGYTLAAFCLRHYVSPSLIPIIDNKDQRWVGAWWIGWLIIAGLLFLLSIFMAMFPKELPAKFKRALRQEESLLRDEKNSDLSNTKKDEMADSNSSLSNLLETLKRIVKNKIFMCTNIGNIFYFFGYMPYWIFSPKYLEIVFRQSAAESNTYTGTVALVFTAVGVLTSGMIISKIKPRARYLAGWNAFVGILTVAGFFSYSFIGCPENESSLFLEHANDAVNSSSLSCAEACHCEFVPYTPVCGENNLTYISPCHAGCREVRNEGKIFYDCDCIRSPNFINATDDAFVGGTAVPGACPVDCFNKFLIFLFIMCTLKFFGSSTRASFFLIQMRCVAVEDKTISVGLSMVLTSLLCFVPSPIFYGWLYDRMCLVWGGTCSEKGNCWLYDSYRLRHTLNYTASAFLLIGAFFECCNCYFARNLNVFDEDEEQAQKDKIASNLELSKLGANM